MPFHVGHPSTLEAGPMKRTAVALSAVCALTLATATGSGAEPGGTPGAAAVPAGVTGPPVPDTARTGGDPNAPFIGQQKYSTVYEGVPGEIAGNPFAEDVVGRRAGDDQHRVG
jgi:hypothetical protein